MQKNTATIHRTRSPAGQGKIPISIRLDKYVIDAFAASGNGYQTRMNAVLADWVRTNRPEFVQPEKAKPGV